MKMRTLLWLLVASVAGYGSVLILFPGVMSAAAWGHTMDRNAEIGKAREIANAFGLSGAETTAWVPIVKIVYDRRIEHYLAGQFGDLGRELFTPLKPAVSLYDPQTGRHVTVEMNSAGKVLLFDVSVPKDEKRTDTRGAEGRPNNSIIVTEDRDDADAGSSAPAAQENNSPQNASEADKQVAQTAFRKAWGEKLFSAATLTESSNTQQGARLIWKAEDQGLKLTAKAVVRDGQIKTLALERDFTPQFEADYNARRNRANKFLASAEAFALLPAILLVIIFYFIGVALNRIQHRQGLIFLTVTFVLISIISATGSFGDDLRESFKFSGSSRFLFNLSWLLMFLATFFIAVSLYFFWAAGQALAIKSPRRRTISMELLLRGKLLTRPVAKSLAVGLLTGGIVTALPLLAAASRLFPGIVLDSSGPEDLFASRLPALSTFFDQTQYLLFVVFGFLAPLISAYIKRPLLVWALVFISGCLALLGTSLVYTSFSGLLITGLAGAAITTTLYFRDGLLAVLASQSGAAAVIGSAAMLAQPAASLNASGWRALACLIGITLISLAGAWKFRDVAEEETAVPAHLLETRIERERLKAEFNVAQRAQQQMLPAAPPQIPGLDIAAVCRPSKEVGGDLYDFIPLPDGKLGIVVADVSGKGVPASLYMTLTKGLLASIAETQTDPGEILREVNRHLYEACRRKMFVTLFLGVIDPATRKLTYARAGHNPTVFRNVAHQRTSLLKPRGMGLGLNNGNIFNQSLKVEVLQLEPNDKLFFYSDGITEAMNPQNEEYGEERLIEIAAKADRLAAAEARDAVLADVTHFLGSNQPQDDQTLVVVKVI